MQPKQQRYNVRTKNHILLRDVDSQELKDWFQRNPNQLLDSVSIEVWVVEKPCCRDEDKYVGAFPASKLHT